MDKSEIEKEREKIGEALKKKRMEQGVSTYMLEKRGLHTSMPALVEGGKTGYTVDSLIKYLAAIGLKLSDFLKNKK